MSSLCFFNSVHATENIIVYNRNMNNDFVKTSIENVAKLSQADHGGFKLVASEDMEQGDAFDALVKGEIDIIVTSATSEREKKAKLIHVPLDRGLLGFRLCLVHKDSDVFFWISDVQEFITNEITIGVGEFWADRIIFEQNNFATVTSSTFSELFSMLAAKKFDCFSRSVNEISNELREHKALDIKIEPKIVIIYPNADFIFVNPHKPELLLRFTQGMDLAIQNESYFQIFDTFFGNVLEQHQIYERRLIFLQRDNISEKTLDSINKYGIASFIQQGR